MQAPEQIAVLIQLTRVCCILTQDSAITRNFVPNRNAAAMSTWRRLFYFSLINIHRNLVQISSLRRTCLVSEAGVCNTPTAWSVSVALGARLCLWGPVWASPPHRNTCISQQFFIKKPHALWSMLFLMQHMYCYYKFEEFFLSLSPD